MDEESLSAVVANASVGLASGYETRMAEEDGGLVGMALGADGIGSGGNPEDVVGDERLVGVSDAFEVTSEEASADGAFRNSE